MTLHVVTAPTSEPLTVADVKGFLRVTGSDEDTLISALISVAREHAELKCARQLLTCTRKLVLDDFPASGKIRLPRPPIASVSSVKYYDTSRTQQTMTADTDYRVDVSSEHGLIYLPHGKTWPSVYDDPNMVEITYVCGWTSADSVPEPIKQWMRIYVATLYENREQFIAGTIVSPLPSRFIDGLLDPYRLPKEILE